MQLVFQQNEDIATWFLLEVFKTISVDSTGDTANDKVLTEFIPLSEPCRLERIQTLGSGSKQCIERDHFVAEAICRI